MGKQTKSKKQECVGKGKVTPVQIAFIVDRYLSDNGYAHTRSAFRSEASNLIAKSPVQEAPKSLLSLGAILDEYITLKEQKVWVDQERRRLDQEKLRVQSLLSGMQNVMNAYNASENTVVTPPPPLPPPAVASGAVPSQSELVARPAGYYPMYNSPAMMSTSKPLSIQKDPTNFSTPIPYHPMGKRKEKDISDGPMVSKKSRKCPQPKAVNLVTKSSNPERNQEKSLINSAARSSGCDNAPSGSTVVKCLFNQDPPSPPANYSSVPKTPPRASSSQTEKSISPVEVCSTATSSKDNITHQQIMSTNCTIISSETIRVSPNKQISYYSIEKNHISTCSPIKTNTRSSSTKDHVKGRLDFGTSEMPMITENQSPNGNSTSESEEGDILDLDLPNLDALGLDFNLSEFLIDFDMESEGLGLSSKQVLDSSPDCHSWSPSGSGNAEMGSTQVTSDFSSTMTGFLGDRDMHFAGADSVAAMRSVTKCITIVSPVKRQRSNYGQDNNV